MGASCSIDSVVSATRSVGSEELFLGADNLTLAFVLGDENEHEIPLLKREDRRATSMGEAEFDGTISTLGERQSSRLGNTGGTIDTPPICTELLSCRLFRLGVGGCDTYRGGHRRFLGVPALSDRGESNRQRCVFEGR